MKKVMVLFFIGLYSCSALGASATKKKLAGEMKASQQNAAECRDHQSQAYFYEQLDPLAPAGLKSHFKAKKEQAKKALQSNCPTTAQVTANKKG